MLAKNFKNNNELLEIDEENNHSKLHKPDKLEIS